MGFSAKYDTAIPILEGGQGMIVEHHARHVPLAVLNPSSPDAADASLIPNHQIPAATRPTRTTAVTVLVSGVVRLHTCCMFSLTSTRSSDLGRT